MKTLNCKLLVVSAAILLWFCQTGLSAISVGGRVSVTQNGVNVRAGAGSTTVNGQQNLGALGAVTGGPTNAQIGGTGTTYTWWNVNFDSGADGWVASINLAEVAAPTMTLGSPNAGATWQVGTSQTVNWSVSGDTNAISYFVVRLSTNNGSSYTDISSNLGSSTRSFSYTPTSSQATTTAVCWVRGFNAGGTVVAAAISSGAFTISIPVPTMSLSSPNAGATWQVGTSQTVDWSVSGDTSQISFFVVKLSTDNSNSYTDISSNLSASTRSFSYTPTGFQATTTAVCWVRAFNSGGTVVAAAISSGPFTIAAPTMTLSSPNAGATWQVGTNQTVGWSVSGNTNQISYFVVRLSTDNSNSYTDISSNLIATTRSFSYTPTSGQATTTAVCWVRAFNSNGTFLAGAISSGPFTITNPTPALSITTTAFNPATATVGTGYAAQVAVTATGGQTPYSWSASGLPNGMSINSSTGAPFGTPTVAGTFNVNVTVTDSSGPQKTASKTLTLTVNSAANSPGPFTLSNQSPYWDPNAPAGPAVRLNWTLSSGATSYDVYRNGSLYATNLAGTTYLNNLNLTGGQTYSYYIVTKNSYGTRQSDTLNITMPTAPLTPPPTLTSLTIIGPSSVAAGDYANYTATAQYSDGTHQDVTSTSAWRVSGGPLGTTMAANQLHAGRGGTATAQIHASFTRPDGGMSSAAAIVNIGASLSVRLNAPAAVFMSRSGDILSYRLQATAVISGAIGTTTAVWKWNGTTIAGQTSAALSTSVSGIAGTGTLAITVTDNSGTSGSAQVQVTLNKPPQSTEPVPEFFGSDPFPGTRYNDDGLTGYAPIGARTANGFVVIVHGLNDKVEPPNVGLPGGWMARMGQAIEVNQAGSGIPNILLYDWNEGANPSAWLGLDRLNAFLQEAILDASTVTERVLAALTIPFDGEVITAQWIARLKAIRPEGKNQGRALAEWMIPKILSGEIDPNQPIQLIGHSAGGFVIGECAERVLHSYLLAQNNKVPSHLQITMLDTPLPYLSHINNVKNPGKVELYVSTWAGSFAPNLFSYDDTRTVSDIFLQSSTANSTPVAILPITPIVIPDLYYHIGKVPQVSGGFLTNHSEAHEWYIRTIQNPDNYGEGFYYSPFLNHSWTQSGQFASPLQSSPEKATLTEAITLQAAVVDQSIGGFATFGNVADNTGVYKITEQDNAGLSEAITVPVGADSLKFRLQFSQAGDGDYLEVSFGDHPPLEVIRDAEFLRGSPGQFEVSVSQYAGETGILIFKLVSRGQPNAQVTLDQIAFSISDDPDHDGLTNAQEAALGTNPNSYDTDGDGWSDAYEINVSHTNPLLKDSDGDGVPDPQEVIAGTDPNDNTSVFAVKDIKRETDGSMTIRWNGQPSKTYQVQRSSTPGFESFDVIATKITGTSPLTSYTDPAANLQGVPSAFYRIEVE